MRTKSEGFTLAEILISLSIVGLVVTSVLGLFIIGSNSIKQASTRRDVTWVMEKKLSEVKDLYEKYPHSKYLSVTPAQISEIVTNVSEVLPDTNPVDIWDPSGLSSMSGAETMNKISYNFIISFYSDTDEIKQVGLVVTWYDQVTGQGKNDSSTIFISRDD
jgi:prepilin-type N-terminal cleavage/methylation domain-containing protein